MKQALFLLSVLTPALAMAQAAPGAQPSMLEALFPFVIMFVILYFVLLRPQMRKQKEHTNFVSALKRGDEIITQTGILGRIEGMTEQFVTLEIADGVRIKMLKSQVAGSAQAIIQKAQQEAPKK